MTVYTVSSVTELEAALSGASGGDVVELAAGDYGSLSLRGLHYDSEVTVISADPEDPAVFQNINMIDSSNLTFDSLFIDFTPNEYTVEWSSAFRAVQGVSNIALRNSRIEGGTSVNGVPSDSEPGEQGPGGIMGEPIGRAVTMLGNNIVLENNDISVFKDGIVMAGDGNAILNNEIHGLRTSPIRGKGTDLTIDGNYFHDSNPWKLGGHGDHGDYIHLWTSSTGEPMSDITITNNVFSDEAGKDMIGIYLDDNHNGVGYRNVTIENNVIYSSNAQSIRFENVSDAIIARNTIVNDNDLELPVSQIRVLDGSHDILIEKNILSTVFGEEAARTLAEQGIILRENLDIDHTDPNAENSSGRVFADSTVAGASLWEKFILPGEEGDGLGSSLMALETAPARLTPVFKVERVQAGEGDLVFDATLTRGPGGAVTDDDATFLWEFGDGTTATGQKIRHSYDDAGRYDVTLTVTGADGSTAAAEARVAVAGTDVLSFDPETGLFMAEGYGESSAVGDSDSGAITTPEGYGVDLGGNAAQASVPKEAIARFFGTEQFTMAMTLSADQAGSYGEVARVHGSFILKVTERGEVNLLLGTSGGGKVLETVGLTVNDGAAHDITIDFDGAAGTLRILSDGELAAATEVSGATKPMASGDLVFGRPSYGINFDAKLTAFDLDVPTSDYPEFDGDAGLNADDAVPVGEIPLPDESPDIPTQPEEPDDPGTIDPGGVYLGPDGSDGGSGDTPTEDGGTQDRTDAPADDPQTQPEEPDDPVTIDPGGVDLGPDGPDGGSGDMPVDEGGTQDRTDAPADDPQTQPEEPDDPVTIDPGGVDLGPDGSDGGSGGTPVGDGGTQDRTDVPVSDTPIPPEGPVYRADFAAIGAGEGGGALIGDTFVEQKADGGSKVVLDGENDWLSLGRVEELESSQQLNVSLNFQRSDVDHGTERMVWNHAKFGIAMKDDSLLIHVGNTDRPFHRAFDIGDAGIDDTDEHSLNVAVDAEADRLQVVLDGEVVLDEQGTDLDFVGSGGNEWGWSIGTAWNRYYEGSVSDFELDDQAVFVDDATAVA